MSTFPTCAQALAVARLVCGDGHAFPRVPADRVAVWTVQSSAAWRVLCDTGVLRADGRRAERLFRPPYEWLRTRLAASGVIPPNRWPLWGWSRTSKLDLGYHLWCAAPGDVVILAVLDRRCVIQFDSDVWTCVLNGWPAFDDEASIDAWWDQLPADCPGGWTSVPEPADSARRASWERLFESCSNPGAHLEACWYELRRDDVVRAVPLPVRSTHGA